MLLNDVVATSRAVAATRSRLAKTAAVAEALRAAEPDEVELVASYLSGRLPQRRTGVGWRSLSDLPSPAGSPTLSVAEVDATMRVLEAEAGIGSAARRAQLVADLFTAATAEEQQYLRALMVGEVRQGALDGVLLAAIAAASELPEAAVRRAVMLAGFPAAVARVALADGVAGLAAIGLEPGRPLRPMLAASAPDVPAAIAAMKDRPVVLERKLDGIRLQLHKVGNDVRLFTRSLDEITQRLPEVVTMVRSLPVEIAVLDAEAIALQPDGRPLPFQVTGARTASSADGEPAEGQRIPVSTFCFDLLHVDGHDLLDLPLDERARRLTDVVPPAHLVPRLVVEAGEEGSRRAVDFFADQVRAGHEGVLVKSLDAPYAAGRRGSGWIKVKPRHTLDLVVLAVEWGSGRRRGKLSNIHLGARDSRPGGTGFVMLGKTFKGMTDEMLAWQTERFLELETHRDGHVVYLRPEQVVEIAFDGVQRSTRYPGGVALRFARVLRYRDDKPVSEIDSLADVLAVAPT